MKTYEIAGLIIAIDWQCGHYFKNNIEVYETKGAPTPAYTIRTILTEQITIPPEDPAFTHSTRLIHKKDNCQIITSLSKENIPLMQVETSKDLKTSTIRIKKTDEAVMGEREYILTSMVFLKIALKEKRVSLHGSAIAHNGEAIIFSAPSRTGKSTHRELWQSLYPSLTVINDDKPLIYEKNGTIFAAGTPFSGKTSLNTNTEKPLKAIVFLAQGEKDTITSLSSTQKMHHLMRNIYRPSEAPLWDHLLDFTGRMIEKIPMHHFCCTMTKAAPKTLHDFLFRD